MTVELIAETLAGHRVSTDYNRHRGGVEWWCTGCSRSEQVYPSGRLAHVAAARHQAEMVHQALADGAPPVVRTGGA